jgi:2-oxoglutarate/2-oxoacid ferredoxin oxidoreductase subunit alpha
MKKLMKGNEAIAEAAIQAGCRFFFGYPITPQNQIPEYMSKRLPQVGGCFLQAESEVAAINMVYGAGGAGARVMTSSSSPGISLKQEGISYIVGAQVPCVIVNMVRGGPGLGSIQPAQSDYYQATRGGGHGDYRMCVLAPGSVQEAVNLTQDAFDIADRYRNPVLILGDGLIGQMMEPVDMDAASDRVPAADLKEKNWAADGHVPTQDSPRAIINSLYIDPQVLENHCTRLQAKYDLIAKNECRWQEEMLSDADIVLVAYGTTSRIARSAMRKCRQKGIKVGLLRPITLWPFPEAALRKTLAKAKDYLVLEMSMGQMVDDVRLAVNGERPVHFYGRTGGMVPTVADMVTQIEKLAEAQGKPADPTGCDIEKVMRDAAGKIDQAADAVGKKLDEAGKKIGEKVSNPEFQQKAQDVGKQVGDFATRTADTVVKGVGSLFGAVGKAFETVQKDLKDIEQKADGKPADPPKPADTDGKEGE